MDHRNSTAQPDPSLVQTTNFVDYSHTCGIATAHTPKGWIAGEPELLADPHQRARLTPAPTEEAALITHWDRWSTETLDELEELRAAYTEVRTGLEAAGLDIRERPGDRPGTYCYSYAWHEGRWSADYASEGAAITAALIAMQQQAGASC